MHVLIIGGSDAGISAGLRAHELDPSAEVTIALADDYPNYSVCGIPYYISGETPDWRTLAHRTEFGGINVLRRHTARVIDAVAHTVGLATDEGAKTLRYDQLVVATGANPVRPDLHGHELEGVFLLRSMDDAFAVHAYLERQARTNAVLVGAGYIGLEMADALTARGIEVTLLSRSATVLPTVEAELGDLIATELRRHHVRVCTGVTATRIERVQAGPDSPLSVTDSAGDVHAESLKVFDLAIARTGISDFEAREAGFDPLTIQTEANDHKAYYPGAVPLQLRVTGDRATGRLLGAQIVGPKQAEITKRVEEQEDAPC